MVRMFNRLGICASSETALRYVQHRIEKRATEGVMTSADHYARAYCGKQQLSWHGTTVQIAQPKPLTLFNKVTNEVPSTEKEQNRSVESPIKRGKFQYKLHPCTE